MTIFELVMGVCHALQILAIKGIGKGGGVMGGLAIKGGGWVNPFRNLVSDSVEWNSKKLWKLVKTDVKQ